MRFRKLLQFFFLMVISTGCSFVPPEQRRENAERLAGQQGWHLLKLPTHQFTLAAFVPDAVQVTDILTIYIEGDGLAWITPSQPSGNPTPIHPLGLELALKHPQGVAVYLARPCQYVEGADARSCSADYWTDARFAPEVIAATNQAIDQLKQRFGASAVELVGYSGGGAVAALVTARRKDVIRLITVAGNLDHEVWSAIHRTSPLKTSLNPTAAWKDLVAVAQLHLVGENDENVPPEVLESYRAHFPESARPEIRIVTGFDHACCWVAQWATLYTLSSSLLNISGSQNR